MIRAVILACVTWIALPSSASPAPFEYRGFIQGMSLDAAKRTAKEQGLTISAFTSNGTNNLLQYYQIEIESTPFLIFCNDKLMAYSFTNRSDFQRYIEVIVDWQNKGFASVGMTPRTSFGYDGKKSASLRIRMVNTKEPYFIDAMLYSIEGHGVINYQLQFNDNGFETNCFSP